jgi:hypothetical protein
MKDGFADAQRFWSTLWWSILADTPTGLSDVDCPVILAQGSADLIACGQTVRFLPLVPGAAGLRGGRPGARGSGDRGVDG